MRKILLLAALCAGINITANAQLPQVGSVAPDFTLTDINGVSHHLYSYLDSGYAVLIDLSATWCPPCWDFHNSGVLDNLVDHYGANGSITPHKVKVLFIEGDPNTTSADLHGTGSNTQGNWVGNAHYPIIDNDAQNANYLYGGYPSITLICRDRLIAYTELGYGSYMGQESFWLNLINSGCPSTAPASGSSVDAKAVPYTGENNFLCSLNPTFKFQNYSVSSSITNATIKMYSGSNLIATQPWTGNLAPLAITSVTIPSFIPAQIGPFSFEVVANGDANAANNKQDAEIAIILATSSTSVPFSENFESSFYMPSKFHTDGTDGFLFADGTSSPYITGANGAKTKCVQVNYFNLTTGKTSELLLSNYNNLNTSHSSFEFDVSYAQYAATGSGSNDKLEVLISSDCGQTWTSVWSKSGVDLKTHTPVGGGTKYYPSVAADWRHEGVSLDAYKSDNLFIKFKMTSNYGNYGYIDNIKVTNTTSVEEIIPDNSIKVYPNPTTDIAHITFNVTKASNVTIQVTDVMGRIVSNVANENMAAGTHQVDIQTANLPAGVYNIRLETETGSRAERLTVTK